MKKMNYLLLAILLMFTVVLSGCELSSMSTLETPTFNMDEMERVDVYLPDFEEECKADWKAFYEKYKDVVIVVTGRVSNNALNAAVKDFRVIQGGDGRGAFIHMKFDEEDKTEQVMNLQYGENIVMEGVLVQPKGTGTLKPSNITLEHCKLLEWSERINRMKLSFDITPAFEETKAELLEKYPFVKNIEFRVEPSNEDEMEAIDRLRFITDVEPGTDPQEVLAYANYGIKLLNENARKIDDTLAPSSGDTYGGLYRVHYMGVWIRPKGVVEAHNKYYVFEWVTARVGQTLTLQKAYR